MKKIILICFLVIFIGLTSFAEINFEAMDENINRMIVILQEIKSISRMYQRGKWTGKRNTKYSEPFTAEFKQTLRDDFITLKAEFKQRANNFMGEE